MGKERLQSKMNMEVEHASGGTQSTVTISSSTGLASTPKTSMFAKKSGFVIPKNKLSGSLVPLFRGTKKGDDDLVKEEATNQVQRKTKWGSDLTLDSTVRKGRALAYQTRINQISQQLTLGTLELDDNEDSLSKSEFQYGKTSDHQLSKEESELLEYERREIIGEILKLNPTYKAPADYKPLLKEAKVPIPIKEYPGYNFVGLVFGAASDTHKRLEKETGAKIQVYGTKADTGVKVPVTPTDGKEIENAYEDVYIHVTADTFEKVDAAVALIELLVTPVSVNPVSSSTTAAVSNDNVNVPPSQSTPTSIVGPAPINQGAAQPYPGSLPPPQGQFPQYPQQWFSPGPANTPTYTQSGLVSPGNTVQVSSSNFNPTNMPSLFGPKLILAPSFSPVPQNPPGLSRPQLPHSLQPSYMQQAPPLGQTGHNIRPMVPALSQSAPPMNTSSTHIHHAMASQNMGVSGPPLVSIPNNMGSQQFRGGFSPSLPSPASQSSPSTIGPMRPAMPMHAPQLPQPGMPNFSGSARNFDSVQPLSPAIRIPQQPSSSDFTFQPQRPPNPASQFWPNSQPGHHNVRPIPAGQASLGPQSPFLRPMPSLNPSPGPGFQRPQGSHQFNQPRAQAPRSFAGSPTGPPRHPILPGHNADGSMMVPHMQPRNFIPHPLGNPSGPFPLRPGSQMHIQENHGVRPQRLPPPHQHFGNHHHGRPFSNSSGVQQTYDPFSPTSVPRNPQMGGNTVRVHGENDPEYEDLMASVGVK